jgi:hypothetical protein
MPYLEQSTDCLDEFQVVVLQLVSRPIDENGELRLVFGKLLNSLLHGPEAKVD